ncbi:PP2C family protein-serine/threonine phosphatase [Peterkaempfera bronchialis]|uniref:Response regulator n=1 Tax=Peterkaempfera bronchialis TaxID=2126346 RepID=A0A345SX17_9ACTN|nr:SpoIIE family protein phosphatase [Peterkaempfera bronchialis]AXI78272.1 response regulator [Peterkaempfera bronchialis]
MPATGDERDHSAPPPDGARTAEAPAAPVAIRPCPAQPRSGAREPGSEAPVSAPIPRPRHGSASDAALPAPIPLLVVENDASDARLIERQLTGTGQPFALRWARGLEQAARQLTEPGNAIACVLLDLAVPDARGLAGLHALLRSAPHTAVLVLTGAADAHLGAAAVAAGAQDFLIKHETDGPLLARAIRYAVERKRADESQRRLVEAELRGQENARLQRHLLPTPLLDGSGLAFHRRYRPGRRRALLGGDFYDAVRTDDGTVHVVIGDVCGHGPDEAALGVALRIAWRTLVFAGLTGEALLSTLQRVLEHERRSDEIFATLCMMAIAPDGGDGELYLAGHPAPLLLRPDAEPELLPADEPGPALGLVPAGGGLDSWPPVKVRLGDEWGLLLYTDGLIEGRVGAGSRRLGQDGLLGLIADHQAGGVAHQQLIDSAIAEVEDLNGGALTDDVAVLLLERIPRPG